MRTKRRKPVVFRAGSPRLHISAGLHCPGYKPGEGFLAWYDAPHVGPVPEKLDFLKLSRVRDKYFRETGMRARDPEPDFLERRIRVLRHAPKYPEILLWFEAGWQQLSLVQALDWLSRQPLSNTAVWLAPDRGDPDHRVQVMPDHYQLASRAWAAFRAPGPTDLLELVDTDTSDLPDLRASLMDCLRQYPSRQNGLSALEQEILEDLAGKGEACSSQVAFQGCLQYGDRVVTDSMRNMLRWPNQPIRYAEPFYGCFDDYEFGGALLMLTDFGRLLLERQADAVAFCGIDRWIGGVHLTGQQVSWRWDCESEKLIAVEKA